MIPIFPEAILVVAEAIIEAEASIEDEASTKDEAIIEAEAAEITIITTTTKITTMNMISLQFNNLHSSLHSLKNPTIAKLFAFREIKENTPNASNHV